MNLIVLPHANDFCLTSKGQSCQGTSPVWLPQFMNLFSSWKNRARQQGGRKEKKKKTWWQWCFGQTEWLHLTRAACHSNTNPTWAVEPSVRRKFGSYGCIYCQMELPSRKVHMGLCMFHSKTAGKKMRTNLDGAAHSCHNLERQKIWAPLHQVWD